MRRCWIEDVKIDYSVGSRNVFDQSVGFSGRAPGEPVIKARLTLIVTTQAAEYLGTVCRNIQETDPAQLLGDLGLDRPDLERAKRQGVQEGMMLAAKGPTAKELAKLLREPDDTTADKCGELHSSGIACQQPKGHEKHVSIKGWKWDEESEAKDQKRKGRAPPCEVCKVEKVARSEVNVAAGLPGNASWSELVEAVRALKIAADPPYEPKTKPARAKCPQCGSATIVRLARRTKTEFTACTAWPSCKWTFRPPAPLPPVDKAPDYTKRDLDFED